MCNYCGKVEDGVKPLKSALEMKSFAKKIHAILETAQIENENEVYKMRKLIRWLAQIIVSIQYHSNVKMKRKKPMLTKLKS